MESADITGDRRLSDFKSPAAQFFLQFFLCRNAFLLYDLKYCLVTLVFHIRGLHPLSHSQPVYQVTEA